jgi:coatomer protein complex subunit gamma
VWVWAAGEAEEDGYEDEYQLEDIEIGAANYIKAVPVSNFRKAWEDTDPASEISDDYGLGVRDSLQVRTCCLLHPINFQDRI